MEIILVLAGIIALAAFNRWNEQRLANRIRKSMDKVMGRDD